MVVEQGAHSFEDMTNISKETRTMLESNFVINHIKVDTIQRSDDGTIKCSSFARWFSGGVCFDSYQYKNNCLRFQPSGLQFRL
jgi:hypothetical protein